MRTPAALFPRVLALAAIILAPRGGAQAQDGREEGPIEIEKLRALALALATTVTINSDAIADPAKNCVSNYFVTDIDNTCIGDLVNGKVAHTFKVKGVATSYGLDFNRFEGILELAVFIFPTSDCSGTAYMQLNSLLPIGAFADTDQTLWTPNPAGVTTIDQHSFIFGAPPTTKTACEQANSPNVPAAPVEVVSSTFINSLVSPSFQVPWRLNVRPSLFQ